MFPILCPIVPPRQIQPETHLNKHTQSYYQCIYIWPSIKGQSTKVHALLKEIKGQGASQELATRSSCFRLLTWKTHVRKQSSCMENIPKRVEGSQRISITKQFKSLKSCYQEAALIILIIGCFCFPFPLPFLFPKFLVIRYQIFAENLFSKVSTLGWCWRFLDVWVIPLCWILLWQAISNRKLKSKLVF